MQVQGAGQGPGIFKKIGNFVKLIFSAILVCAFMFLLSGFLLETLFRGALHEPGFHYVNPNGTAYSPSDTMPSETPLIRKLLNFEAPNKAILFQEPAAFCPSVENATEYYIAHLFWPDVSGWVGKETDSRNLDNSATLVAASASHNASGTLNITRAAEKIRNLDCAVSDTVSCGLVLVDGTVVYPVEDIVRCSCSTENEVCPKVRQLFDLIQAAAGPSAKEFGGVDEPFVGIQALCQYSQAIAYFLTISIAGGFSLLRRLRSPTQSLLMY